MFEAWLAMGIDCDGNITILEYSSKEVSIAFSNTQKELIDMYAQRTNTLGCRTKLTSQESKIKPHGKKQYFVSVRGTNEEPGTKDKLIFLKAILPYLCTKKNIEKAKRAIPILEKMSQKRDEIKVEELMKPDLLYTTTELAEMKGIEYNRAYQRLYRLEKKGIVVRRYDREIFWQRVKWGQS